MRSLRLLLVPALAACGAREREIGVFPVGEPVGASVEVTLGPDGGTFASADGDLVITVPAGAVDADTVFSVQEITRTVPHGEGRAWRLEPHGQVFAEPVTLAFADTRAPAGLRLPAWQNDEGHWVPLANAEASAGTITVETTHFSDWTLLGAYTLVGGRQTVRVGESTEFEVHSCLYRDAWVEAWGHELPALARTCEPLSMPALIRNASVDGLLGGDDRVGRVKKQGATLHYTAPGRVPEPDVVAVSAEIHLLEQPLLLLVRDVRIVDDVGYVGKASLMQDGVVTAEAEVTWIERENFDGVVQYVPSGVARAAVEGCTLDPASAPIGPDDGSLEIDWSYDPPRYYGGGLTMWQATLRCPDAAPVSYPVVANWLSIATPVDALDEGRLLEGSQYFWTWSFVAPE